ncbi:MAG: EndoU domain-containing protein, partial [Pseudomonadales bacterium]
PEINLWHVFEGEINRKGKPTGFHARPGGQDPANARVKSIKDRPNRAGVYTANIEVRDGGQWKGKFSSFFPDSMSQQEVVNVILHAYRNSKDPRKQPWSGPSGLGFQIQGYTTSRGGINTAFPVYNARQ